jgi:hypothetical protein
MQPASSNGFTIAEQSRPKVLLQEILIASYSLDRRSVPQITIDIESSFSDIVLGSGGGTIGK